MTNESPTYVERKYCWRFRRYLITTILGSVALVMTAVVWAVTAGHTAEKRADQVDTRLQVHEGKQETHERHLHETLERIEQVQQRIFDKVVNGK